MILPLIWRNVLLLAPPTDQSAHTHTHTHTHTHRKSALSVFLLPSILELFSKPPPAQFILAVQRWTVQRAADRLRHASVHKMFLTH